MKSGVRFTFLLLMLCMVAANLCATTTAMPYSQPMSTWRTSVTGEVAWTACLGCLLGGAIAAWGYREMNAVIGFFLVGILIFGAVGTSDIWMKSMFSFTGALI